MVDEIRFTGDLTRIELKPGDIFVLTFPDELSPEDEQRIRRVLEQKLPNHKVIVLCSGAQLSVVNEAN